jgi:hypothetical protein
MSTFCEVDLFRTTLGFESLNLNPNQGLMILGAKRVGLLQFHTSIPETLHPKKPLETAGAYDTGVIRS